MAAVEEAAERSRESHRSAVELMAGALAFVVVGSWVAFMFIGSAHPRVSIVGDSITVDAAHDITHDLDADYTVEVRAHGGRRIDQMLPYVAASLQTRPSAIVVNLGTNDVIQAASHPNWRTGFDFLIALLSKAPCAVITTVNTDADFFSQQPIAEQINLAIRSVAVSHRNVHVLDWNALVHRSGGPALLLADGIHPTSLGSSVLAQNLSRTLRDDCGPTSRSMP